MTFEKALEAMRQGKEVIREYWAHNSSAVIGIDTDGNGENRLYIRHLDDPCKEKRYCNFGSSDALANDWKIYEPEPKKKVNSDAFKSVEISPGKALDDLWFVKANQHTEEYANQVIEILKNSHLEFKEESTMYTDLEITFKSGETITYKEGEWDDYSYDGKSVAVKKSGAWVGLYNFDNVFCVELKQRAEE